MITLLTRNITRKGQVTRNIIIWVGLTIYDIVLIYTFYWKSISGGKWPSHSIMQSWKTFQVEIHNVFDNGTGHQTHLFVLLNAHTNWVYVMKTLSIKYTTLFKHLESPYLLGNISVQWIWHQAEIMLANKLLSIRNCNDVWVVVEMNGSK